jgi:hypothetical protein
MSTTMITNLILSLLPFAVALAVWLAKLLLQLLPENQRVALDQFVKYAVQNVEQVYTNAGSDQKKTLAAALIADMFQAFHLPVPPKSAIDAAIESTVFEINQLPAQQEAKADINPLKPLAPQ